MALVFQSCAQMMINLSGLEEDKYLVGHARGHFFGCEISAPSNLVHVGEVHHLEGILVGAGAAHHCCDLKSNQNSGQFHTKCFFTVCYFNQLV
jgi:hypothetical protein